MGEAEDKVAKGQWGKVNLGVKSLEEKSNGRRNRSDISWTVRSVGSE